MRRRRPRIRLAVIWIDWYPYHVARMQGLLSAPELAGQVAGIELIGGIGVHAGLRFREEIPHGLPVHTLMPDADWARAGQLRLSFLLWRYLDRLGPEAVLIPAITPCLESLLRFGHVSTTARASL